MKHKYCNNAAPDVNRAAEVGRENPAPQQLDRHDDKTAGKCQGQNKKGKQTLDLMM